METDPKFVAEIANILHTEAMLPEVASRVVAERVTEHIVSRAASAAEAPQRFYDEAAHSGGGPFLCPVCKGVTKVISGFYSMTAPAISEGAVVFDPCRTCNAQGIVWAPEHG
jgi:hypothetical protein